MTQVSPTTTLSDQASVLVEDLLAAYKSGAIRDVDEITLKMRDIITSFVSTAGSPLSEFEAIELGEPPSSAKMNRFLNGAQHDINIMQRQSDFLRASSLFLFNVMATEIGMAKNENEKVRNKLKTLQLYSSNTDPTVISFSEGFASDDYFDLESVTGSKAAVLENTYLTLGRQGDLVSLGKGSTVTVLSTSNGFNGNNLQVSEEEITDESTDDEVLVFMGDKYEIDKLPYVVDEIPYSWFEYSAYQVSAADKNAAANLSFEYESSVNGSKINWSNGPLDGDVLKLSLQITLREQKAVNTISYTPFGMEDNLNHPVLIRKVQTSVDGTNWEPVTPAEVWVGTNQNIQSLRSADNFSIGTMAWSFPERDVKFIQIFVEQPQTTDVKLGHIYYTDSKDQRIAGPVPPLNNPRKYNNHALYTSKGAIQKREYFTAKRWGIGIRDISIQQVKYDVESTYVSKPIFVPGGVDRIALDADIYVPASFGVDDNWVSFYVSGDDGETWEQISRITDDYLTLPEVISFNDPTPEAFKESGVLYVTTEKPVGSVRVKIVLKRPASLTWSSPLVRSYDLRIKQK